MFRIILIPFFLFALFASFIPFNNYIALALFIIASLTDLLDGKIARKRNLVTNFGKFMDPIADKLLTCIALIALLVLGRISSNDILAAIAVIIIIAREFIISGFRLVACEQGLVLAASYWGKFKTATQMIAICLMIVLDELTALLPIIRDVTIVLVWVSVTLTIVSLVDYLVKNISVIKDGLVSKEEKQEDVKAEVPVQEVQATFQPKFDEETGLPLNPQ